MTRNAIAQQMGALLAPKAAAIFTEECQIPGYQVIFIQDWVFINARLLPAAWHLVKTRGGLIAQKLTEWFRTKCEVHSAGHRPLIIKPGNNIMKPKYPWISGNFELTPALMRAMSDMCESESPKGLVTPAGLQLWVNPAAVTLFRLSSMEQAVPRDTTSDWLPEDLEFKRQCIRDAGDRPFEIAYRTQVGDGTWKRLVNSYQLIDEGRYLVGENLGSEVISRPTILV